MMRVLVTGGRGQLARAMAATWNDAEIVCLGKEDLDLGAEGAAEAAIEHHRPDVVINAGAMTSVDGCESSRERALLVNGRGVGWLARACERRGARFVQISSDYVFDGLGAQPLRETDPTAPATVYGQSKLLGEREAAAVEGHLILRTAWLFGGGGRDFVATMLRLGREGQRLSVVDDQRGSPTSALALARQIRVAVDEGWRGLVHATCAGEASWFELAEEVFRQAKLEVDLWPARFGDAPRAAARPRYTVLDNGLRRGLGPDVMGSWREALAEALAARAA